MKNLSEIKSNYLNWIEISLEEFEKAKAELSPDQFIKKYSTAGTAQITADEYMRSAGKMPKSQFEKAYSKKPNPDTQVMEFFKISHDKFYKLESITDSELNIFLLDELVSEINTLKKTQLATQKDLSVVKGCVVFFTVLTVISLISTLISAAALASIT